MTGDVVPERCDRCRPFERFDRSVVIDEMDEVQVARSCMHRYRRRHRVTFFAAIPGLLVIGDAEPNPAPR